MFSFFVDKVIGMDSLGGCGDGGVLFSIICGFSVSMLVRESVLVFDLLGLRPKFGVHARYYGVVMLTTTVFGGRSRWLWWRWR